MPDFVTVGDANGKVIGYMAQKYALGYEIPPVGLSLTPQQLEDRINWVAPSTDRT